MAKKKPVLPFEPLLGRALPSRSRGRYLAKNPLDDFLWNCFPETKHHKHRRYDHFRAILRADGLSEAEIDNTILRLQQGTEMPYAYASHMRRRLPEFVKEQKKLRAVERAKIAAKARWKPKPSSKHMKASDKHLNPSSKHPKPSSKQGAKKL